MVANLGPEPFLLLLAQTFHCNDNASDFSVYISLSWESPWECWEMASVYQLQETWPSPIRQLLFWKHLIVLLWDTPRTVKVESTVWACNERLSHSAFLIIFCFVLCFQLSLLLAVCFHRLVRQFHINCFYLLSVRIGDRLNELMVALQLNRLWL